MTPDAVLCATIMPRKCGSRPSLGGPRFVCGKPLHHTGPHGDWKSVSQPEHAKLLSFRQKTPERKASEPAEQFVQALQALSPLPGVFNPWRDVDADFDADASSPRIRSANLCVYLRERLSSAKLVLIGEAPGFRGGKFSGIAMTSERILLGEQLKIPPDVVFHGPKARTSAISACEKGFIEPTASIVWSLLLGLKLDPREFILWNAFPCHPYKGNNRLTNRKPTASELQHSAHILRLLLSLVPNATLVAVGRVAESALKDLGLTCHCVRHPAMGGANDFRAGIRALLTHN